MELSTTALGCEWIFVHEAQGEENICGIQGEQCCSFLGATGPCLSITSSCLCHRRSVVHRREPQPTLLMQGQTHRHDPQVALKQMLPHTHIHKNLLPVTALRKLRSDQIHMTDYTVFSLNQSTCLWV